MNWYGFLVSTGVHCDVCMCLYMYLHPLVWLPMSLQVYLVYVYVPPPTGMASCVSTGILGVCICTTTHWYGFLGLYRCTWCMYMYHHPLVWLPRSLQMYSDVLMCDVCLHVCIKLVWLHTALQVYLCVMYNVYVLYLCPLVWFHMALQVYSDVCVCISTHGHIWLHTTLQMYTDVCVCTYTHPTSLYRCTRDVCVCVPPLVWLPTTLQMYSDVCVCTSTHR